MVYLAFALVLHSACSEKSPSWISALMASDASQLRSARANRKVQQTTPVPHQVVSAPTSFKVSDGVVSDNSLGLPEANEANRKAMGLLESGQAEKAYVLMMDFREAHPGASLFTESVAISAALLSGHYSQAYSESVSFIQEGSKPRSMVGETYYLQLSLAGAGLGQVFPGQNKYCIESFNSHLTEGWGRNAAKLESGSESAKSTMVRSALALGVSSAARQAYLELALKLDPTNEAAGHLLLYYDQAQGRYSDLRRVANSILAQLKEEGSKDYYRKSLAAVSGLADRPAYHQVTSPSVP